MKNGACGQNALMNAKLHDFAHADMQQYVAKLPFMKKDIATVKVSFKILFI